MPSPRVPRESLLVRGVPGSGAGRTAASVYSAFAQMAHGGWRGPRGVVERTRLKIRPSPTYVAEDVVNVVIATLAEEQVRGMLLCQNAPCSQGMIWSRAAP